MAPAMLACEGSKLEKSRGVVMLENGVHLPDAEDSEVPSAAPSIVIVEKKGRNLSSLFLPPAMIVLVALAILSFQRQTPIRSLGTVSAKPVALAPKPEAVPVKDPAVAAARAESPIVARLESRAPQVPIALPMPETAIPTSLVAPVTIPHDIDFQSAKERSHFVPSSMTRLLARGDDPPEVEPPVTSGGNPKEEPGGRGEASLPNPPPAALPSKNPDVRGPEKDAPRPEEPKPEAPRPATKKEIEDDIRREAARKEAERRAMQSIKPPTRRDQIDEARRSAQRSRKPFHEDLRKLLKMAGRAAGPQIESLCDQYGRTTLPEIREAVGTSLKRTHGGLSRQSKVEMMRRLGLPEPNILEFIANEVHHTLNMPSGPKDPDEVWVRSARILLAIPLNPPRSTPAKKKSTSASSKPVQSAAAPTSPFAKGGAK